MDMIKKKHKKKPKIERVLCLHQRNFFLVVFILNINELKILDEEKKKII